MTKAAFFDAIRPAMGKMSPETIKGIEALLDAGRDLPLHHMANVLAQVRRETGGLMFPIKETVMPYHKDKHPSDTEVIRRLDNAYARGQLRGVRKPYWRDGEFGRGQIQLTHKANRDKFGVKNRDDLLKLEVSAQVAVVGMRDGLFRGKKLADYTFPRDLNNPPKTNPRRIVNGVDGSDKEVAASHLMFAAALEALEPKAPIPDHVPVIKPKPNFWAGIIAALAAMFRRK